MSRAEYINVDASWQGGVAGLAIVGALGTHRRIIRARSSTQAEHDVMRWAIQFVRGAPGREFVIRTDNATTAKAFRGGDRWRSELVRREQNTVAHGVAARARRHPVEAVRGGSQGGAMGQMSEES